MRSANAAKPPRGRDDPANAPVLAAMDLLGQRWMLRILWELEPERLGFLELRRRMGNCSSSMLSVRLQHLQAAGLIAKNPDKSYELTTAGTELGAALRPVWEWSRRWQVSPTEVDRASRTEDPPRRATLPPHPESTSQRSAAPSVHRGQGRSSRDPIVGRA